jgi:hypothetical protein
MKNLIAYIQAQEKELGRENLATRILAEIIRSPIAELPFRNYLGRFGVTLPCEYSVCTHRGGAESRAIPDLWIRDVRDEQKKPPVIIESKFDAGFTDHQPKSYLKEIDRGGLLLFIVPDKRLHPVFLDLCDRCKPEEVTRDKDRPRQAEINGRYLVVSSWTEILRALDADPKPLCTAFALEMYNAYLYELRGFCDVASKEVFLPLTDEQIRGNDIAGVIHQLKWLVENIIRRCIEGEILKELPRPIGDLSAGCDSSFFFGRDMLIGDPTIWIGFSGSAWEEWQQSPLWIQILDRDHKASKFVASLRRQKGHNFVVQHSFDSVDAFMIPIPMTPGQSQAEVVISACQFVADLKRLMVET